MKRKSADAFAVKTHIFGERLSQSNLVALSDEHTHGLSVIVDVAASESLVGHVEKGEQISALKFKKFEKNEFDHLKHAGALLITWNILETKEN
uniref:Uncharacterized protein n=1 Tax=Romanomermis culicivorax TaxID=13658 RepID=A0A915IIX7_ROMCU